MADSIVGTAVYMLPGQSLELRCPIKPNNNQGFFVRLEALPSSYFTGQNPGPLLRGFVVENKDVGEIKETDNIEAAVVYTHKQPYSNAIWFFARTGERGLVKIVAVPIHDHSTIIHGGPAYGTYFDDDIER